MDVCEGTSFELSDGTWQKPEVVLTDGDLELSLLENGFTDSQRSAMTLELRYQWLSAQARKLILRRILEARKQDKQWLQTEGKALVGQLQTQIHDLTEKIKAGGS